jgi:hypothetical protein
MYSGPARSERDVARIRSARVLAVDGQDWQRVRSRYWQNWVTLPTGYADVVPGHYDLDVDAVFDSQCLEQGYAETHAVSFDAAAGHEYAVRQKQVPPGVPPHSSPEVVFGWPLGLLSVEAPLPVAPPPPPQYRMYVWIEDLTTGKAAGGNPPPAPAEPLKGR